MPATDTVTHNRRVCPSPTILSALALAVSC